MKVYVSGPMTGYPEFNYPAFTEAAAFLRSLGHEVVSPHEVNPDTDKEWAWYLRRDIAALLECEAVAFLPGWHLSKGAKLEVHIADMLGMRLKPLSAWTAEDRL